MKNQFRNLDEDEIEFLDSVLESTRAKEEAVKKETAEQLDLFRRQQEEADKALLSEAGASFDTTAHVEAGSPPGTEPQWTVKSRKRKRTKDKEGLSAGLKLRRSSTSQTSAVGTYKHTIAPLPGAVAETNNIEPDPAKRDVIEFIKLASASQPSNSTSPKSSVKKSQLVVLGGTEALTGLGLAGYSSDED